MAAAADYQEICRGVLALDRSIRYVGLADHLGSLVATVYREGLVPLSSKEETEKYTAQAVMRTGAIQGGSKVGRLQYVIGRYENLIRVTLPVVSDRFDKYYMMLSLDVTNSNPVAIMDKVLEYMGRNKLLL